MTVIANISSRTFDLIPTIMASKKTIKPRGGTAVTGRNPSARVTGQPVSSATALPVSRRTSEYREKALTSREPPVRSTAFRARTPTKHCRCSADVDRDREESETQTGF